MKDFSNQLTAQELCKHCGVKFQDFEDLLELYNSDAPEDEVLARIERYPEQARALVSSLILPGLL